MKLTKENVCPEDHLKRKKNIIYSEKIKRERLTFLKTVRQDERKKISRKRDTRT